MKRNFREILLGGPKIGDYIICKSTYSSPDIEKSIGQIIDIQHVKSIFPLNISKNYHINIDNKKYTINEDKIKYWSSKKEKLNTLI